MYVGSYSPIQSAFSSTAAQGWPSGQTVFPVQQSFSAPVHVAQALPVQTGIHPLQYGSFAAVPYNAVSYSFSPGWQSSGFVPSWGWNQSNAFSSGVPVGAVAPVIPGGFRIESSGMFQPRVDLAETNTDLVVTAELPNINPNDINLTVTDDSLSISAMAFSGNGVIPIHRTVCLPTSIKCEQVNASFNNGVLEARCPKSDASVRRRIRVSPSI